MVGKTERTLKRNILDPMSDMLGFALKFGQGEFTLFGKRIYLVGANDERAVSKIHGGTFGGAYGDELTLWPESFFTMLLSRLSPPGAKLFGTTNPDSPNHWLKKDYLDRQDQLSLFRLHFKLTDNVHLDREYVTQLQKEYTGLWRRRYIDGEWVMAEGAVYDMFCDDHIFTGKQIPDCSHYYVGIDYGTVNPTVFLLVGIGKDNKIYVIDEYRWDSQERGRQKTDSEYVQDYREFISKYDIFINAVYSDPSAVSFMLQMHRNGVKRVRAADNTVIDGIRNVSSLFSNNVLKVHERCQGLINEMYSYVWDSAAQAKGEDKPLKMNDHFCDSLRYICRMTEKHWKPWLIRKAA